MSDPFQISHSKNVAAINVRVYEIHLRDRARCVRAGSAIDNLGW